ncbi:MAG: pSer/pThr/pTyr-binding forkhead associated (FHA) protein [Candidatus Azotimanducaceae bacterium]|jgi:pSer/pThr/pTyr-binding forkhead associated (FHA) protein
MFSSTTYTADKTQVKPVRQPQRRIARIELDSGVNFTVTESSLPLQIGRERDCDITLPNGHVSRHHCELFIANGVLCLKDTSSNGTLVGSQNIKDGTVTIHQRTAVVVAGDSRLVITPLDELESTMSPRKNAERREDERREAERRHESIIVPFEQRRQSRRERERRSGLHL